VAVLYVRSTDGNDADNGTTWALAKATLAGAFAIAAAGDRIWVSQAHAESSASAITLTSPGTAASPCEVLCGNDAAEPPTALATTATVTTTGAVAISFLGFAYCYGITFNAGTGSTLGAHILWTSAASWWWRFEACGFAILNTNSANQYRIGGALTTDDDQFLEWVNCTATFGATGQSLALRGAPFVWTTGSLSGATIPTTLLSLTGNGFISFARLFGVDLSAAGSGKTLASFLASAIVDIEGHHCKLGASVTLIGGTPTGQGSGHIWFDNCDSADTNYRMQRSQYQGDVYSETVVVRNGGATDGTTRLSWRMVTSADSKLYSPLPSPVIAQWNDTTGSAKTLTVSLILDGAAALDDDEVWVEVEYLGTAGFPLSSFADDAVADILATPAAQATDTGSDWDDLVTARANITAYSIGDFIKVASNAGRVFRCTTAGTSAGSEPAGYATAADGDSVTDNTATFRAMRRQKVNVAVTPQEKGLFQACVKLAVPSTTVYVDPLIVVT